MSKFNSMRGIALAATLLALAGMADRVAAQGKGVYGEKFLARSLTTGPYRAVTETVITVNFDGTDSWDGLGSALNVTSVIDVAALAGSPSGTPYQVNGIGWEGSIETYNVGTFGGSWVSEARVNFNDDIFLTPGFGLDEPSYASLPDPDPVTTGGIIDLVGVGLPPIQLPNGMLPIEFFESFDDQTGAIDGRHVTALLSLDVSVFTPPNFIIQLQGDTTGDPLWNRPSSFSTLSGVGTATPYEVIQFVVDTNGSYIFNGVQEPGYDGYMLLYEGSFDPNNQLVNLIALNDDGAGGIGTSDFTTGLSAGTNYFLVNTGFANDDFGMYTVDVFGPEGATLTVIPEPASLCLIAGGLLVSLWARRRR